MFLALQLRGTQNSELRGTQDSAALRTPRKAGSARGWSSARLEQRKAGSAPSAIIRLQGRLREVEGVKGG